MDRLPRSWGVPLQTSKESRGTKREKERGGKDVEERKGAGEERQGAKEEEKEREETVGEVERMGGNLCLLSSGELRCYPMKSGSSPWSPASLTALQRPF